MRSVTPTGRPSTPTYGERHDQASHGGHHGGTRDRGRDRPHSRTGRGSRYDVASGGADAQHCVANLDTAAVACGTSDADALRAVAPAATVKIAVFYDGANYTG